MHRQDAAAGHPGGAVEQIAGLRRPLFASAPGRRRDRPGAGRIRRRAGEPRADVHRVVLAREVLAFAPSADHAQAQRVEVVVHAERQNLLVVLEDRLEVRVHLAKAVDLRTRVVVERWIGAVVAEGQRSGEAGEDAGGGGAEVRRLPAELVRQTAGGGQRIAHAHLVRDARPVVVFLEDAEQQPGARRVVDFPREGGAQRLHVAPVHVVVDARQRLAEAIGLAVGQVLDVAVAAELEAGHAHGDAFAERQVQRALPAPVRVVAVFHVHEAVGLAELGPLGDEVDGAAGGVAPEQRALRAAQDLHPLHVEELDGVQVGRHGHFVEVQRHAGFAGAPDHQIADAADAEAGAAEVGGGERHVRRVQLQVRRVDDLLVFQGVAVDGRDRDGHVLRALGHALGGDDDLLDGTGGRFLREPLASDAEQCDACCGGGGSHVPASRSNVGERLYALGRRL